MAEREYKATVSFNGVAEVTVWVFDEEEDEEDNVRYDAADMVESGLSFSDGTLTDVTADVTDVELVTPRRKV